MQSLARESRSLPERLLGVFTEVRRGEGPNALLLLASVFLILFAYYLIKPAREGWLAVSVISGLAPIEVKAYSTFGQALVLIFAVSMYARLAARWERRRLISVVTLFFAANLPLFWLLQPGVLAPSIPFAGVAFYLWVGVFNVFIVAMFWSFAADYYTDEDGRRLIPLVAVGATAGAAVGSWFTDILVRRGWVETFDLLLLAAPPLLVSAWLARRADARGERASHASAAAADGEGSAPWTLIARHRYLSAAALLTLVFAWVGSNSDNILFGIVQGVVRADAAELGLTDPAAVQTYVRESTTGFYGNLFLWINLVTLAVQSLLVSRLLRYGGFGLLLLFSPVLAVAANSSMALAPLLLVIKTFRIVESSSNYSINNTARHVLWLRTTAEMKYKAKAAIDTFCVRVGDGLASLTVLASIHLLGIAMLDLLWLNVVLGLVWITLGAILVREYRILSGAGMQGAAPPLLTRPQESR